MKKRKRVRMDPPCDCRVLFRFAEAAPWREPGSIVTIGTKIRSGKLGENVDSQVGPIALPARHHFGWRTGSVLQCPASCCGAARRPCLSEASAGGGRGGEVAQPPGRHTSHDCAEARQLGQCAAL